MRDLFPRFSQSVIHVIWWRLLEPVWGWQKITNTQEWKLLTRLHPRNTQKCFRSGRLRFKRRTQARHRYSFVLYGCATVFLCIESTQLTVYVGGRDKAMATAWVLMWAYVGVNVGLCRSVCRKNCRWMWSNIGIVLSANVGLFRSAFVKCIVGGPDQTMTLY